MTADPDKEFDRMWEQAVREHRRRHRRRIPSGVVIAVSTFVGFALSIAINAWL